MFLKIYLCDFGHLMSGFILVRNILSFILPTISLPEYLAELFRSYLVKNRLHLLPHRFHLPDQNLHSTIIFIISLEIPWGNKILGILNLDKFDIFSLAWGLQNFCLGFYPSHYMKSLAIIHQKWVGCLFVKKPFNQVTGFIFLYIKGETACSLEEKKSW